MDSYRIIKFFLKPIFKILYRPTILNTGNIPNSNAFIFAGNHKNAFDPLLIAMATERNVRFFAKKELFEGKSRLFFKALNAIPVDRTKKNEKATETAIEILNNGEIISLFPEGTRNKTNELLLPFKFGAVSMAKKTKCPIVPFAITGQYRIFRKGIKIEFGTPFYIENMELPQANDYLMKTVENLIKRSIN